MKATNSNKNLKGTDRDEAVMVALPVPQPIPAEIPAEQVAESESKVESKVEAEPVIRSDPGTEAEQNGLAVVDYTESFFVTRTEWNDLMERIAKHNRQSPHPF